MFLLPFYCVFTHVFLSGGVGLSAIRKKVLRHFENKIL